MTAATAAQETGKADTTGHPRNENTPLITLENNADTPSTEVGEITSNADLYSVTPPAYTQSIAEDEQTVAAETLKDGKPQGSDQALQRKPLDLASPRALSDDSDPRPSTPLHVLQERARGNIALTPTGTAPTLTHYLTEAAGTVSLIGARTCDILRDRPAIWLVRNKSLALSPLAAAVLVKEGLVNPQHLELISQSPSARRDPTDPISAIMLGVYDYIQDITLGLVAGPVELNRQATPLLSQPQSNQRVYSDGAHSMPTCKRNVLGTPEAAAQVGIETGKGMLRILTASLKTPVQLCNGVTRGFHNWPKVWGEEVREYENVTGLKSGLVVSAKSFGYGMGDGLLDIAMKPYQGAQRDGGLGFATGFAKGIGNAVCKTAAGACGLVGYTSVGIYKEIRNIKLADDDSCPTDLVQKLGEVEYANATDSDKLYVVRVWCQNTMPVRLA